MGDGNEETKAVHYSNLWRIVRFCENKTDCRRSLQLNYFGELFKRENCVSDTDTACDNCSQMVSRLPIHFILLFFFPRALQLYPWPWRIKILQHAYKMHDATEDCKNIVRTVGEICGGMDSGTAWNKNFTSMHIVDIFKGSNCAKVVNSGKLAWGRRYVAVGFHDNFSIFNFQRSRQAFLARQRQTLESNWYRKINSSINFGRLFARKNGSEPRRNNTIVC